MIPDIKPQNEQQIQNTKLIQDILLNYHKPNNTFNL